MIPSWLRHPRLNDASPQAAGLVLWYPLCSNETAATAQLDCSGMDNHVTATWSATKNSLAYMPGYGNALAFADGNGVHRPIAKAPLSSTPFTISFWFRRTADQTAAVSPYIISLYSGNLNLFAAKTTDNTMAWVPRVNGLGDLDANAVSLGVTPLNQTIHVAITGSQNIFNAYVTNAHTGVTSTVTKTWSGTEAQIGSVNNPRAFGTAASNTLRDCLLADFRIYNRALTAPEVRALHNPATRFDLFAKPSFRVFSIPDSAPANPWAARPRTVPTMVPNLVPVIAGAS